MRKVKGLIKVPKSTFKLWKVSTRKDAQGKTTVTVTHPRDDRVRGSAKHETALVALFAAQLEATFLYETFLQDRAVSAYASSADGSAP